MFYFVSCIFPEAVWGPPALHQLMFRDRLTFGSRALLLFCSNKECDFNELVALFYSAAVLSVPCVCITDSDLSFFAVFFIM